MNSVNDKLHILREKTMKLPLTPGVYIMKNKQGKIIYIGKAKKLKNRVSQYFGSQNKHPVKVRKMVENVHDFDYILTDSEFEALVLEASLIKQNQPKYNILLKDDKGYSYIKITNEPYRKISAVLQKDDENAEYIGPFTSSYSVKQSVDEANKIFRLPQCNKSFPRDFKKGRPCLNFHINRCMGVCTGKISKAEYDEAVNDALDFLNGDITKIIKDLKEKMNTCAENLEFEKAGKYRDRIRAIENMQSKQKVVTETSDSKDVFALAENEQDICITVLRYDKGRLCDSEYFFFDSEKMVANVRGNFLIQYYGMNRTVPQKVYVDEMFDDMELLQQHLTNVRGKKCLVTVPQRGEGLKLVNMCRENAYEKLAQKKGRQSVEIKSLEELKNLLGLSKTPEYIESYDISHTGGEDNVAGMIVFKNGKPFKRAYRTFNIKSFTGQDDYGSMREVLSRRFDEYYKFKDENATDGFGKLPDLILLDGGKGQVNAVKEVMTEKNLNIPLFGMVKDSKHKTRAITGDGGEIAINSMRSAFTLVSEIQEEVHRFSVGFHHKKHTKKGLELSLTKIDGIGEKKAKELLKTFKTIKNIKSASVDELEKVKGINRQLAEKIHEFYSEE
ncbi:MAG: excinuclease ABC subunit UvrC [Clostridia bacterium]|nr:excinuclease ABC subunit UvrC [Clostridia bacterium]